MSQIQSEITRLQVMADDVVNNYPESKPAKELADTIVPGVQRIFARAEKELEETGQVTSATYDAGGTAMTGGEDAAWSLDRDYAHASTKLVCRQFDNIHIMMNALTGLPVPENHKCWPPEDPNCH